MDIIKTTFKGFIALFVLFTFIFTVIFYLNLLGVTTNVVDKYWDIFANDGVFYPLAILDIVLGTLSICYYIGEDL